MEIVFNIIVFTMFYLIGFFGFSGILLPLMIGIPRKLKNKTKIPARFIILPTLSSLLLYIIFSYAFNFWTDYRFAIYAALGITLIQILIKAAKGSAELDIDFEDFIDNNQRKIVTKVNKHQNKKSSSGLN